jgi:hypothetical protein
VECGALFALGLMVAKLEFVADGRGRPSLHYFIALIVERSLIVAIRNSNWTWREEDIKVDLSTGYRHGRLAEASNWT